MSNFIRCSEAAAACLGLSLAVGLISPAFADDASDVAKPEGSKLFTPSAEFTVDGVAPLSGSGGRKVRELDLLTLGVGADFETLGWNGGTGQLTFQNSSGGQPNIDLGTLDGVDNNEVGSRRGRLFEAWLQQDFGDKGSLKVGLIDFNSEFYANDASGVLIAPELGIGTEAAASGPGGPPLFPVTSLGARLQFKPTKETYIQGGVFNANLGTLGDPGGIDTKFDLGVFEAIEIGWTPEGKGKFALGGWRYSKKQDALFDTVGGEPLQKTASGGYVLAERTLVDGADKGPSISGFLRAGFSDGDTGPLQGSWQLGALIAHPFASRPDGQFSIGVDQALLGSQYRKASLAGGTPLKTAETHVELTYADQLTQHITVQPDLQYIANPGGDGAAKNEFVFLLRLKASFGG